jgi:hypothetical protein
VPSGNRRPIRDCERTLSPFAAKPTARVALNARAVLFAQRASSEMNMVTSFRGLHPPAAVAAGATHRGRAALSAVMRSSALVLQGLAERVAPPAVATRHAAAVARLEYHCEAGAPEGALYVDGVLFGYLEGVQRL